MCAAKESDESGDLDSEAGARSAESDDENVGVLWRFGRAEEMGCKNALQERDGGILDGSLVLLREVAVERVL